MKFGELTQIALLGTERQSLPAQLDTTALGNALRTLDPARKEETLLAAAALISNHERVGQLPNRDTAPGLPCCAAEPLPQVNSQARSLLRRLLDGDNPSILPEWLAIAAAANQIVSPELLPALLRAGTQSTGFREAILRVIGERGRWLAGHNSEWNWVAGDVSDDSVWQTGTRPARVLFLHNLRSTEPARALDLLRSTWKEEAPEDRAAFISELETGLGAGDEPFLETALGDKHKEVRRIAAQLLAHLPSSGLVQRMTGRAKPLLKFDPGQAGAILKLQRAKKSSLEITLPVECDNAMQRDGIEPKPPQGFGEKAWWLIQLLDVVPLDVWTRKWTITPDEIIAASQASEWKNELWEAWTKAATSQRNAAWASPLLEIAIARKQVAKFPGLLLALPSSTRESRVTELLEQDDPKETDFQAALLVHCGDRWSPEFSHAIIEWLRRLTSRTSTDWTLRSQFKDVACKLNPAALSKAAQGWRTDAPGWDFWSKGMDEFFGIVQFRSDLYQAFAENKSHETR